MRDGRRLSNRPDALRGAPLPGIRREPGDGPRGEFRAPARGDATGGARGQRGGGRGGRGVQPGAWAPIVVNGLQVGIVSVPPSPPAWVAAQEFGPTLAFTGFVLLVGGATAAALLIFRPTHRRLRSLEAAAQALGEGQTHVRAEESGGDEVTTLARTFNRMAQDLEARAQALADADRARRQLLADVSHELMTPLTAIRGYVQTLAMDDVPIDEATRRRYLAVADQETYKLEAIIGDLLDLARLESGGEQRRREPVAIADLFDRVVDRHLPEIQSRGIETDVRVAPAMPTVPGHAGRLEQALQNLASNAIRHMPDGGRLTLTARADEDRVVLEVRDTGPGIPAEHLPHIFDRFYKADASRVGDDDPLRQRPRSLDRSRDRPSPRRRRVGGEWRRRRRGLHDPPAAFGNAVRLRRVSMAQESRD